MRQTNPIATVARPIQKAKDLAKTDSERFENIVKAGLTVPGLELKIVDSEDMSIEMPQDGEAQGELLARGPWITGDYYKLPEEDREGRFYEGWLVTGDIASIDAEGYLIIRDRSKDLIKSGGEWISSVDLENAIAALPGVAMACVVAMPHPRWDERPVAIVQVRRDPVAATQFCRGLGLAERDRVLRWPQARRAARRRRRSSTSTCSTRRTRAASRSARPPPAPTARFSRGLSAAPCAVCEIPAAG